MSETKRNNETDVDTNGATAVETEAKQAWHEPKLEFVEPKLVRHGEMKRLTGTGFIGTFVPEED
jgi:hypothetical protein